MSANSRALAVVVCALIGSSAAAKAAALSDEDVRSIKAIVTAPNGATEHVAADLDWENAFGTRYTDLAKRDKFYESSVKPLQASASDETLEIKVRAITPDVAVADAYWHIVGQIDQSTGQPGADRWGRTTSVFQKEDGQWLEVLERVADLRAPYYKHYQSLPEPAKVPIAVLSALEGTYGAAPRKYKVTVAKSGDRLDIQTPRSDFVAIPESETSFLGFRPDDLADYYRLTFEGTGPSAQIVVHFSTGEIITRLPRVAD
jgi:ketosteroid isomerase-like protein